MRNNLLQAIVLSILVALSLSQATAYNPFPKQTPDNYSLGPDREKLPFRDDIANPYGAFIVEPIDPEAQSIKDGKSSDLDNEVAAENYYTILVPGNDRIVRISVDFALLKDRERTRVSYYR